MEVSDRSCLHHSAIFSDPEGLTLLRPHNKERLSEFYLVLLLFLGYSWNLKQIIKRRAISNSFVLRANFFKYGLKPWSGLRSVSFFQNCSESHLDYRLNALVFITDVSSSKCFSSPPGWETSCCRSVTIA